MMDSARKALLLPRLLLIGGALLFSTGGLAIKATDASGWAVSGLRSAIACVFLLLLLPAARRGITQRALLVAFPYAATLTLFTLANKLTTAANAIFLQDTAPLYLLLIGPLLLRESVRLRDLWFMAALLVGLLLFFVRGEAPQQTATDPYLGNQLAVLAGVAWALTLAGMRWLARDHARGADESLAAVIVGNALGAFIAAPFMGNPLELSVQSWAAVTYLGIVQIGIAYLLVTRGMRTVPALQASLLLLVEPVFSPLWSWLFLNEIPSRFALLGGAVILGATAVHTLSEGADFRRFFRKS